MNNLYWMGIRESEIEFCKDMFKDSITIFGNTNISMQRKLNKVIDHNNVENFDMIDDFFNAEMLNIVSKEPNAKFMYYSQINSYDSIKRIGLLKNVICLNNQDLVNYISDKFKLKQDYKNIVPILEYKILKVKYCNYQYLSKEFNTKENDFVIQSSTGSGGSGTYILNNKNSINFSNEEEYMVTKYCKNNIPINIHVMISKRDILLLPGSVQLIEIIDNKLSYKGCDFLAYNDINSKLKRKAEDYAYSIAEKLREKGYIGICGIDSIIYEDEVYLMEVNTRFQNSSTIVNLALKENKLPSLQELNIRCFKDDDIRLRDFKINYSCYIKEENIEIDKIKIKPIIKLDEISNEVKTEKYSYSGSLVFDKSIFKYIK